MGSEFDVDTAVEPVAPGEYTATVTDRWDALSGPNGGYLLAICMRALAAETPLPDPLVVSAHYLRGAKAGPATLRTEVVRTGRRTATGQVSLVQGEKETMRVLATFSDLGGPPERTVLFNRPPSLPPPEECADPMGDGGMPGIAIEAAIAERSTPLLSAASRRLCRSVAITVSGISSAAKSSGNLAGRNLSQNFSESSSSGLPKSVRVK